jgi:hypothetical protein
MVERRTAQTTNNDEIQVDHNRDGIDRRGVGSDNVFKSKTLDTPTLNLFNVSPDARSNPWSSRR